MVIQRNCFIWWAQIPLNAIFHDWWNIKAQDQIHLGRYPGCRDSDLLPVVRWETCAETWCIFPRLFYQESKPGAFVVINVCKFVATKSYLSFSHLSQSNHLGNRKIRWLLEQYRSRRHMAPKISRRKESSPLLWRHSLRIGTWNC